MLLKNIVTNSTRLLLVWCILIGLSESIESNKSVAQRKIGNVNQMILALTSLIESDIDNVQETPPYHPNKAIEVLCLVAIENITAIEDNAQMLSLELHLETHWVDDRLNHTDITEFFTVPDKHYRKLWKPDVGFSNAQGGFVHTVTEPNRNILIGPNGQMYMTGRVAVELACPMNFTYYPMDSQLCEVQLQSWKYNEKELLLKWKGAGYSIADGESLKVAKYDLHIGTTQEYRSQFFNDDSSYDCVETYAASGRGSFSCLELNFVLRRKLQFYALDIYIPSALIVLVSFIGLFVDFNVLPARLKICALSVAATTNVIKSFKQNTPPVAYTKAADVWVWACQLFVFAIFLELGLVNVFNRNFKDYKKKDTFLRRSLPAKTIDKVARLFFPITFLAFVVLYWACYIPLSQYNQENNDTIRRLLEESWFGKGEPIQG